MVFAKIVIRWAFSLATASRNRIRTDATYQTPDDWGKSDPCRV